VYHYRVLSRDAAGNLSVSGDFTFTTSAPAISGNGVISGTLFNDLNGDGVKNGRDSALTNWQVYFDQNNSGQLDSGETSVRTNSKGVYRFSGLAGGTYRIREVIQSGFRLSNPLYVGFQKISINSSSVVSNINFGNTQTVMFAGAVFQDLNGNGLRDLDDPGLSGWTAYIDSNDNGKLDIGERSVLSDSGGKFAFIGNAGVTYVVRVVQNPRYQITTGKSSYWANMVPGETRSTILFGEKLIA